MDKKDEENNSEDEAQKKYDEDGKMFIKLGIDDSALVVRADGTIELVSHDLEHTDDGYVGDIEDLSKTFSLVLALASALENEDLYNRIYHNLNKTLMKKWDSLTPESKEQLEGIYNTVKQLYETGKINKVKATNFYKAIGDYVKAGGDIDLVELSDFFDVKPKQSPSPKPSNKSAPASVAK